MTLEDAIAHCKEISLRCDACGADHRQLAGWLEELQCYRKSQNQIDSAATEAVQPLRQGTI